MNRIMQELESRTIKRRLPDFGPGDTVVVQTAGADDPVKQRADARIQLANNVRYFPSTLPDVRTATVVACLLEESADLQLRMLAAAGGDASRLRAYTREEAERVRDQISGPPVARAWEYYSTAAEQRPLGG